MPAPVHLPVRPPPGRDRLQRIAAALSPSAVMRGLRRDLALEMERGLLFLMLPLMIGAGAAGYFALSTEPDLSALLAGSFAFAGLLWLARRRHGTSLLLAGCLCILCGMVAARLETGRGAAVTTGSAVTTTLTGRIAAAELLEGGRMRLIVETSGSARPALRYLPERVRITTRMQARLPRAGDGFTGRVRLMPPPGPVRPGGYDFSFESHFDGTGAIGFVFGTPRIEASPNPDGLSAAIERIRHALAERIRARIQGQNGEIAAALVTGYKGSISDSNAEALRTSGLAHILAISGLHMALVAGTVAGGLRAIFAAFPAFAARHPVRKHAALAALLAVSAYLMLSGGAIATQRSYIMLAVMLLALHADRMALTMRNIAIAAVLILLWSPHEITGPGFQMSFAATAALVAAYAAVQQHRMAKGKGMAGGWAGSVLRPVAALLFTSIIAGAATGIYGAFHFQRYAPLGPVANLAAMPIVSLVVMPAALVAHLMILFDLDAPFFWLMGQGIGLVLRIAHETASRSGHDQTGLVPLPAMMLATIALIAATVLTTRLRLLALPFILAAGLAWRGADIPDGWISDDGKTLAIRIAEGSLAFNRTRISSFTRQNWTRAAGTGEVRRAAALKRGSLAALLAREATGKAARPLAGGFACDDQLCLAKAPRGWIVQTDDPETVRAACRTAILILYSKPSEAPRCGGRHMAVIVTARQLALEGSAAFRLNPHGKGVSIRHAINRPYRPWHRHRQWSRTARGLEEWKPEARD